MVEQQVDRGPGRQRGQLRQELQSPPQGRYGTSHLNDVWGFLRLACVDY
jgi:hypothetical protein